MLGIRSNLWPFVLAGLATGALLGLGAYTFVYARGYSYLLDDPAVCANCHVMRGQFDGWLKSSHRAVATCNDCHTPEGHVGKYLTKAINGWNHSLAFTTGHFPETIRANARNRRIAQESCTKCHGELVHVLEVVGGGEAPHCTRCHGSVGHPGT